MQLSRRRVEVAGALALLLAMSGCTFEEGSPWGQAAFALEASFDASARRTDEGYLRTGNGYGFELERLELELGALALTERPEGAAVSFDPANPPAGYSLCHNGHCHAADGRLVDYEDIALELAAQQGVAGGVTQPVDASARFEGDDVVTLEIDPEACSNQCELPVGELASASLVVASVRLVGRAIDTREDRLPAEGLEVDVTLPVQVTFERVIGGAIGRDAPVGVEVDVALGVPDTLLDGVDWSLWADSPGALATSPALLTVIRDNLAEDASLEVTITRREE